MNKFKLNIDLCVFNRPFDYQGNERVALETSIFIYLLERIEKGYYQLFTSEALEYENEKNPDIERKIRINTYFKLSDQFIVYEDSDMERIEYLLKLGFYHLDALHIALAEKAGVNYLITCDDQMVKLFKKNRATLNISVIGLFEFTALEEK